MKRTPPSIVLLAFVAGAVAAAAWYPARSAAQDSPKQPNILFAISDDQSYPHASAYGSKFVNTPAFDRVAKSGVLFANAVAPSPGCSPSRAAMLTGRYPWMIEHAGTHASEFPSKYVVYPDLLEKAGYTVGFTGKGWGPGNWKVSGRTRNPAGNEFSQKKMSTPVADGVNKNDYAGNFELFLKAKPEGEPFFFWYGGLEPHRSFEEGIGLKSGKKLEDAEVPAFLPDTPEIRSDLLDYAYEIEWFDQHLGRMLDLLESRGELENTLVVVTSDNGMSFPRAKANVYEYGLHLPLAAAWPAQVPGGRVVKDVVSLIDFCPTFLEAGGARHPGGEYPMEGESLLSLLKSDKQGLVDPGTSFAWSSRERHSSSRWNNLAYPQRALRTDQFLYIRNFKPERWPAGAPRKFGEGKYADGQTQELGPEHGGYHDIDGCPSLTFLVEHREDKAIAPFFHLAVDHRPAEELFDISNDPFCLNNLAEDPAHQATRSKLSSQLEEYLRETGDPRVVAPDGGEIWETYQRYSRIREFPKPDWAKP